MNMVAAILAGGKSSRMGTDKAMIRLEPAGPTLIELVLDRVSAVADQSIIIANDRPRYRSFGVSVAPDHYSDAAALGGIATALELASGDPCLVVPCDLPFLSIDLLRHLRSLASNVDVVIPTVRGESRQGSGVIYQTLHAIYGPGCLPPIRAQLASGQRQIVRFFGQVRVTAVPEQVARGFDPELWTFFNVNTPEALSRARSWAKKGREDTTPDISSGML